jgi:hypothetical protein
MTKHMFVRSLRTSLFITVPVTFVRDNDIEAGDVVSWVQEGDSFRLKFSKVTERPEPQPQMATDVAPEEADQEAV